MQFLGCCPSPKVVEAQNELYVEEPSSSPPGADTAAERGADPAECGEVREGRDAASLSPVARDQSPGGKGRITTAALTPMSKALKEIQLRHTYLAMPVHRLHKWIVACETAIRDGDEAKAADDLARIEQEVEQEEQTLAAAFNLFKPPGQDDLSENEVKIMLDYLGFPSKKTDVDEVLKAIDTDGDRRMSLVEFQQYVGKMGGSFKLFELRREQMNRTGKDAGSARKSKASTSEGPTFGSSEMRMALLSAGIQDTAQAYWQLLVPGSEFVEAAKLVQCQKEAVRHIRTLAKSNHEAALPRLQARAQALGYDDSDLWMTLAWIREMAPILVHINLDKMMPFLESDTHYRNQFETQSSGGLLKPAVREKWERDLFGGAYEAAAGKDRCKYGCLNPMNDYRGVVRCIQYGDSYLVLKDVRLRCTFSPEDSANLKAERLAVLDYYAHVLVEYTDVELKETVQVAKSADAAVLGDSSKVGAMKYKEAQLHGDIQFDKHVARLVAHDRHKTRDKRRLKSICKKHGFPLCWMDEERARMAAEEKQKLGAEAWKERLAALTSKVPDVKGVPEGYCRKGCGRPIAPGVTSAGKTWKTCCRGCAMGFGHDLQCGHKDPSTLGPGMCNNGCGRKVNPGTHLSGRPYTTCCRSCTRDGTHDAWCGQAEINVEIKPGMCRMGCGRKVAAAKDGRKFDTCCRGCACGRGHSATCGQ